MRAGSLVIALAAVAVSLAFAWHELRSPPPAWSDQELALLQALSIANLGPVPPSPTNAVADNPRAAELGRRVFFDARFSANGRVSCASCHRPEFAFTDGLAKGRGIGESRRNTRSIVGAAWSPWLYWDGRKDSLWSQALSPLEDPAEHGGSRLQYLHLLASDPWYRERYEQLFGPLPDLGDARRFPPRGGPVADPEAEEAWRQMEAADRAVVNRAFANLGKAIAAFERELSPEATRFDRYVEQLLLADGAVSDALSEDEVRGLRLFIGKARCVDCHNGPLLTNNEFHNTGVLSYAGALPDRGRVDGVRLALADPFNCLGDYSDAPGDCAELRFVRRGPELIGATRTPSLRNLADTGPFFHAGQAATLADVLDHYNLAPDAMIGHNEAKPLGLGGRELRRLEAFLRALQEPVADAPVAAGSR